MAPGTTATFQSDGTSKLSVAADWEIILARYYEHYYGTYGQQVQGFSVTVDGAQITITVPESATESSAWEACTAAGHSVLFEIAKTEAAA